MREFWLRMLFAGCLSATGFLATFHYSHKMHAHQQVHHSDKPIAWLKSAKNEVQRKPTDRFIWQRVALQDGFYSGEAVRTASDAVAQIEFASDSGDGTVIELEPDSVVVIDENESGLNLDFKQGNLFIRSKGTNQKAMTLTAGEKKIALEQAEISVGKTKNGAFDVDVLQGKAKVVDASGAIVKEIKKIKVLSPVLSQPIYARPDSDDTVEITWEVVDSAYQITAVAGAERTTLQEIDGSTSGSAGRMRIHLPIGRSFFQLKASSTRSDLPPLTSSVLKVSVLPKIPAEPLEPGKNAVLKYTLGEKLLFRWANPGLLENMTLETARSSDFKKDYFNGQRTNQTETKLMFKDYGIIYWRVSGALKGTTEQISSPVQELTLQAEEFQELLAPVLKDPALEKHFSYTDMNDSGVNLSWQTVKGAIGFEVKLTSDIPDQAPFTYKVTQPKVTLRNLGVHTFHWSVIAKAGDGRLSPESEIRSFSIDDVPALQWTDHETRFLYRSAKPNLEVSWEAGPVETKSWRVRLRGEREPAAEAPWLYLTAPTAKIAPPSDGTYFLQAEALDQKRRTIAKTELRSIAVAPADLLPAPKFSEDLGLEIIGRKNKNLEVNWQPVTDAKEYIVTLKAKDGQTLQEVRVPENKASLKKLEPGEYTVTLRTVDGGRRPGTQTISRGVRVLEASDVQSPKLMKINVK